MKEFFKSLLTEGGYSSKRFTALICLALFVSIVICSLCGIKVESEILYSTVGLITGALGMTMWTRPPTNGNGNGK